MQSIETTGKSVAEATAAAAAKLGVDASGLTVTVLEETKGLFGKSNVRIRAEVASSAPAPAAKAAKTTKAKAAPEPKAEAAPAAAKPARGKKAAAAEPAPEPVVEAPAEEPKKGRRGAKAKTEEAPAAEPVREDRGHDDRPDVDATAEDGERLVGLINELMAKAELKIEVEVKELGGRYVTIELEGEDAAYLVGKQGEVLNATQYLINIIAGRRFNNGIRATLDGQNYRQRREVKLTAMATELARQVVERGEEAVLDALPAFERRVVHKVLSELPGVSTYSEGEEPNRRVVIAPAD
jgi:spoIIIJ-associated protein